MIVLLTPFWMQLKSLFIPINVSFNTQITLFKNDGICDIYEVICVRQWASEQKNLSKCIGAAAFSYHTFWSYEWNWQINLSTKTVEKVRIFAHCQWYLFSLTYGVYRCWSAITKQIPTTKYCQFECKTRYIAPRSRYILQMLTFGRTKRFFIWTIFLI